MRVLNQKIDLEEYMRMIDEIDSDIVRCLEKRDMIIRELCDYMTREYRELVDEEREKRVYDRVGQTARKLGLDSDYAEKIFRIIIEHSRNTENGRS